MTFAAFNSLCLWLNVLPVNYWLLSIVVNGSLLHVYVAGEKLSDSSVEDLFDYVYSNLIEEVDGVDNGIESYDGTRRYRIESILNCYCTLVYQVHCFYCSCQQGQPTKCSMELLRPG